MLIISLWHFQCLQNIKKKKELGEHLFTSEQTKHNYGLKLHVSDFILGSLFTYIYRVNRLWLPPLCVLTRHYSTRSRRCPSPLLVFLFYRDTLLNPSFLTCFYTYILSEYYSSGYSKRKKMD